VPCLEIFIKEASSSVPPQKHFCVWPDALIMSNKSRLPKSSGRVEVFAVKTRIEELRAKGYSLTAIYNLLVDEKCITLSYKGFYDAFTGRKRKKHQAAPAAAATPLRPVAMKKPLASTPSGGDQARSWAKSLMDTFGDGEPADPNTLTHSRDELFGTL
jgi:hypothetical protein